MRWFFGFFLVSGFCSLVYQVVWLRLAMAAYGVTTPLISLILSLFMAGLGLGSWATGKWVKRFESAPAAKMLRFYAGTELLIGSSAILVPLLFTFGRNVLSGMVSGEELGSSAYYLWSGGILAVALLPWTLCMGATFPLVMAAIRKSMAEESTHSFSYLYLANVLGAVLGTLFSAFVLIELLGFRNTLYAAMALNWLLALFAFLLSKRASMQDAIPADRFEEPTDVPGDLPRKSYLVLLLLTGLCSMGMEVVWVRQFTPYVGTVVYAFASILGIYLVATFVGSRIYRSWVARAEDRGRGITWILVGVFSLLPFAAADYRFGTGGDGTPEVELLLGALRVALGIFPFCAALGFLTPMLVDRWSGGDPDRAGTAYAINVLGCLVGPLLAGFVLLPRVGVPTSLVLLAVPLLAVGVVAGLRPAPRGLPASSRPKVVLVAVLLLSAGLVFGSRSFETQFEKREVVHDSTATSVAVGEGMDRQLLINGYGITQLTPMTKMMAHLPMAWREETPTNTLVICFGMGTTFKSLRSWGVPATAVELVPGVPELFGYFHDDADEILASPDSRVVIDDGRRFLERTNEKFDVITIDPPPPMEAAGSSLLYSEEFYEVIKSRLSETGILQQWCPRGEVKIKAGVTRALVRAFPHVYVFEGMDGWGYHFLCSMQPLPERTAEQLVAAIPPRAVEDMLEWGPKETALEQFELVLSHRFEEYPFFLDQYPDYTITDDRPLNEYFFLRRLFFGYEAF